MGAGASSVAERVGTNSSMPVDDDKTLPVWGLEGGIAVGKTTAAREIEKLLAGGETHGFKVHVQYEDMNTELLALFYENPPREAFSFQLHTQNNRLHHLADARRRAKAGELVLMDRTTWGDAVFAHLHELKGNISPAQMRVYLSLAASPPHGLRPDQAVPDIILYLDADPETTHDRMINLRKTPSESTVPLEYLLELDAVYVRRVLVQLSSARPNIHVVDWDTFGSNTALEAIVREATASWRAFGRCTAPVVAFIRGLNDEVCGQAVGGMLDACIYTHLSDVETADTDMWRGKMSIRTIVLPWSNNALATSNAFRRVAMRALAGGRNLVIYDVPEDELAVLRAGAESIEPLRVY